MNSKGSSRSRSLRKPLKATYCGSFLYSIGCTWTNPIQGTKAAGRWRPTSGTRSQRTERAMRAPRSRSVCAGRRRASCAACSLSRPQRRTGRAARDRCSPATTDPRLARLISPTAARKSIDTTADTTRTRRRARSRRRPRPTRRGGTGATTRRTRRRPRPTRRCGTGATTRRMRRRPPRTRRCGTGATTRRINRPPRRA